MEAAKLSEGPFGRYLSFIVGCTEYCVVTFSPPFEETHLKMILSRSRYQTITRYFQCLMLFIFVVFLIRFSWSLSSLNCSCYKISGFFLLTFPQIALRALQKTAHC